MQNNIRKNNMRAEEDYVFFIITAMNEKYCFISYLQLRKNNTISFSSRQMNARIFYYFGSLKHLNRIGGEIILICLFFHPSDYLIY